MAAAQVLVAPAKILETSPDRVVLDVDGVRTVVSVAKSTRFWRDRKPVAALPFGVGDAVLARIQTRGTPATLMEVSDLETGKWLDTVRRLPLPAVVERLDGKNLWVRFEDGSRFGYRATDKSVVRLGAKGAGKVTDLKPGMSVFVKGRLLPGLDTWLAEVSDAPIAGPADQPASSAAQPDKLPPLPPSGSVEGVVKSLAPLIHMIDIVTSVGRLLHITVDEKTEFYRAGERTTMAALTAGARVAVVYARDASGRIIASKVQVFLPVP